MAVTFGTFSEKTLRRSAEQAEFEVEKFYREEHSFSSEMGRMRTYLHLLVGADVNLTGGIGAVLRPVKN